MTYKGWYAIKNKETKKPLYGSPRTVWPFNYVQKKTFGVTEQYLKPFKCVRTNEAFPIGCGCRIHRLLFCREVRPPNECPGYDTKQSDGETPVMLELWAMQSTPPLQLLLGPLWPGMVAPDRALSKGYIEITACICLTKLFELELFD